MPGTHKPPFHLTFWWIWVISKGASFPNLTVRSVDKQFSFLIARNFSGCGNSFRLSLSAICSFGVSRAFNLPTSIRMRCYMLILSHL